MPKSQATGPNDGSRKAKPQRIPNAVRTRTTRSALLEATIKALAEYGYQGASSERIAELSGFTRGAQKHHYRNKMDLVSNALVEIQSRSQEQALPELERAAEKGIGAILQVLWKWQTGDLYTAALELRMAARIDDELRAVLIPAEQEIGRKLRDALVGALDDGRHSRERLLEVGELVMNTLRGMAAQRLLYPDTKREKRQFKILEESVVALLERSPEDSAGRA